MQSPPINTTSHNSQSRPIHLRVIPRLDITAFPASYSCKPWKVGVEREEKPYSLERGRERSLPPAYPPEWRRGGRGVRWGVSVRTTPGTALSHLRGAQPVKSALSPGVTLFMGVDRRVALGASRDHGVYGPRSDTESPP